MWKLCTLALSAATAQVTTIQVDWSTVLRPLQTVAAFQTVVNPLTTQESLIHDQVYQFIAQLGADYQRYVPWLPYPKLGIAELEAPSVGRLCGFVNSGGASNPWSTTLDCGSRGLGTIASVQFASYGLPTGQCSNLSATASCNAASSMSVVQQACVGKPSCTITSNDATFGGSPCSDPGVRLAVAVTCSLQTPATVYTYWNFTLLDQGMLDFLAAANSSRRSAIPNFSTIPSWLFVQDDGGRDLYPDDPLGEAHGYEHTGNTFVDSTLVQLGDYYGRLVAHYVEGGFTDEAGRWVPGYNLSFTHWEVLNEIESEHDMSPGTYTAVYDAIVSGIRRWAPNGSKSMKFVGLALGGSGNTQYVQYFLNRSNHADPAVPLDMVTFHHYAKADARDGGDAQCSSYTRGFFPAADQFIGQIQAIQAIRDALSPSTLLDADEVGVILPDDNDSKYTSSDPGFPNLYWNAAAASYAYIYGKSSVIGLDVLGESQLVGYPALNITRSDPPFAPNSIWTANPQFPSVAMLNWTDGSGTARYWVLDLLVKGMKPGGPAGRAAPADADVIVNTTTTASSGNGTGSNPFCGSVLNLASMTLACTAPGAVIQAIQFASYGTPAGSCGNYTVGACNAANSTAIVESYCLGKQGCTIPATTPIFGDPCYRTVKELVVQANCSTGGGQQVNVTGPPVYAQAYIEHAGQGGRKVLLVNTQGLAQQVVLAGVGAGGSTWTYVDESTAFGPAQTVTLPAGSDTFTVAPFAVGILRLGQ